jgi:hypothetical protein
MLKQVPVSRREFGFQRGRVSDETKRYFEAEMGRPLLEREARVYAHLHYCLVNNAEPDIAPDERKVIDTLLDEGNLWIIAQKVFINPDFYPVIHEVIYDAYVENVLITREEFDMHLSESEENVDSRSDQEPVMMLKEEPESVMLVN